MSKASMGVAVVALVVSLIALGGFGYTYVMVNQAIQKSQNNNNGNNNQQTTTVYGNSQNNGGCTNCASQNNGSCTYNCNGGGTGTNTQTTNNCTSNCNGGSGIQSIVITTSGTTTGVYQCQSPPAARPRTTRGQPPAAICATSRETRSWPSASWREPRVSPAYRSFQSQSNVDAKFLDVTGSQTLQSETGVTSSSFNHQLTVGHSYLVQFTNDQDQNNVLTLSFAITG